MNQIEERNKLLLQKNINLILNQIKKKKKKKKKKKDNSYSHTKYKTFK